MEDGDKIQYACGHWLTAGQFGLQDSYAKSITAKRCGDCQQRLHAAAPDLLVALEQIAEAMNIKDSYSMLDKEAVGNLCRKAIAKAKGD